MTLHEKQTPLLHDPLPEVEKLQIGGLPIARLSRAETADLMFELAGRPRRKNELPWVFTSANGEVLSRCAREPETRVLFTNCDLISADGQPMVQFSQTMMDRALPERVATTDLFHDVAARAVKRGVSFYMLGATPEENVQAVQQVLRHYPDLNLLGHCHGYLKGDALDDKIDEINRLAPDILWLAMGVPGEQRFSLQYRARLSGVGLIKTSGGLFNFLSCTRKRAPGWMQSAGLEWSYRLMQEPRRLFWRYMTTNPHAIYVMLKHSGRVAANDD